MDTISNNVWQRRGSCVIFDQDSLGAFIANGAAVSLRQILTWSKSFPVNPPISGRTILVSGLEAIMETMELQEAEAFLVYRIRPLLINMQNHWTDCGVVFGFSSHPKAFVETSLEEEVLFRRRDHKQIRLSEGLWDGSAAINMKRIVREGDQSEEGVVIGYYVSRIS